MKNPATRPCARCLTAPRARAVSYCRACAKIMRDRFRMTKPSDSAYKWGQHMVPR